MGAVECLYLTLLIDRQHQANYQFRANADDYGAKAFPISGPTSLLVKGHLVKSLASELDSPVFGVSEESAPECDVSTSCDVHELRKLWLIADSVEQGIGDEIRIGEESIFNAVTQHPQSRSFVSEHCVRLRNFIGTFRVSHSALLNLVF